MGANKQIPQYMVTLHTVCRKAMARSGAGKGRQDNMHSHKTRNHSTFKQMHAVVVYTTSAMILLELGTQQTATQTGPPIFQPNPGNTLY